MPGLTRWLVEHIRTTTGAAPGARWARAAKCRRCSESILRGLDDELCAFTVELDPQPLTPVGEALALLGGRSTVRLTRRNGRWQLHRREPWQIRDARPFWAGDVLCEHRCGSLVPDELVAASVFARAGPRPVDLEHPPF